MTKDIETLTGLNSLPPRWRFAAVMFIRVGLPTAVAVVLLWFVVGRLDAEVVQLGEDHQVIETNVIQTHDDLEMMTPVLRQICMNGALSLLDANARSAAMKECLK